MITTPAFPLYSSDYFDDQINNNNQISAKLLNKFSVLKTYYSLPDRLLDPSLLLSSLLAFAMRRCNPCPRALNSTRKTKATVITPFKSDAKPPVQMTERSTVNMTKIIAHTADCLPLAFIQSPIFSWLKATRTNGIDTAPEILTSVYLASKNLQDKTSLHMYLST